MMLLTAFDGMKAAGIAPAINVKVLLDSEEEKGSPSIAGVIRAHQDLLRCDGIVIHDGPSHASERPTLIFGNRGAAKATLTVYGPKAPLHSGHYGNYVPNPAMRMAQLLATMKDEDGRVTVKGYYEPVKLSDAEKAILARTGDDEAAIRKRTGIARAERVGGNYQEALQFPSLNIRGMASGSVGDKAANVVPHLAITELDLRTTPETPPEYLFGLVEKHIQAQGYHLVKGAPSDADRTTYDRLASFTLGAGGKAVRTPLDSPLGAWAYNTLKTLAQSSPATASSSSAPGTEPVRIRMMGGSVPTDSMVDVLGVPFVILPLVNGDNNQHTFDENLRIGNYLNGIRIVQGLVTTPF
jgi:acetylornithine deacetylase/succinyl-diaminopimelate desuccinylase-like protein